MVNNIKMKTRILSITKLYKLISFLIAVISNNPYPNNSIINSNNNRVNMNRNLIQTAWIYQNLI